MRINLVRQLLPLVVLFGAAVISAPADGQGDLDRVAKREVEINKAMSSPQAWDCSAPQPNLYKGLEEPLSRALFLVTESESLVSGNENRYTHAIWSPKGDVILFVSPTDDVHRLTTSPVLDPSREQPVGISRNELWLYHLESKIWEQVSADGHHPSFSASGDEIFFISERQLVRLDVATRSITPVSPEKLFSVADIFTSRILNDGTVIGLDPADSTLKRSGTGVEMRPVELIMSDRFSTSPDGQYLVVDYGASYAAEATSPVTVLFAQGKGIPLLRNCAYSGSQMRWSSDSSTLAYPVLGDPSEIRLFDVEKRHTRVLLRTKSREMLSGISFSPTQEYIAFSRGDHRDSTASIWLMSTDGEYQQRLGDGSMPKWSPDGKRILHAVIDADGSPGWHLTAIEIR